MNKIKLIKKLELIVIDEISMVRCDIIDFIDKILRYFSGNMREPFGGKQLLLVGDIYQLEPVVKDEDRQLLNPFYPSLYFFNAKVWQQMPIVSIELRKVYRQSDPSFVAILDRIRTNTATDRDLLALNSRVRPSNNFSQSESSGGSSDSSALTITLATRRARHPRSSASSKATSRNPLSLLR